MHVEHTIDDIRNEVIETSERGEYRQAIEVLNEARFRIFDTMVECDGFAFLAIGRPEAAGCYCSVNSYLKEVISMLANDFDYVVIDGEAGIEQISRRVMEQVSHLVLVTDQSAKGVNVCREIKEAADDLITYERIGMIVNRFYAPNEKTKPGIKFTSKKILKFAIILLGASLNITTVLTVGKFSLTVMLFTLATCFGLGYVIGKALGLDWKTSSLINAGTGICGGSAIAAIAPVIEATDMDIAYGMSATFLFDTIMVVVFPLLGRAMGLSDAAFGLWAGTAVNDTSSVVATGYAFSEAAGDFATMVKLTRTLAIIPTVLVFAAISVHLKKKAAAQSGDHGVKVNMKSVFPWFILGFLAMSILCSVGVIPAGLATTLKSISKFLMVAALAAIGLNTNFAALCKSGAKPMLHGFIISLLVVLVAIAVEYVLGIAPSGTLI